MYLFLFPLLPLEFRELCDVELAVAVLVERPEDGVDVVLGQLDADDGLEQLPELAALDASLLVAPLGVDGALDVLHVWKSNYWSL